MGQLEGQNLRILVVGPRGGLLAALEAARIPYAVWSEDKSKKYPRSIGHATSDLGLRVEKLKHDAGKFSQWGPFTHVVAGSEAGVFAASVARRVLGARQSKDTVVLRCRDKLLMKRHLQKAHIPMAPFLPSEDARDVDQVFTQLNGPVVSKERWRSGGRGFRVHQTPEDLRQGLGRSRMVEAFVDAPEMSVESFVNGKQILFETTTRYHRKGSVNVVPSGLDADWLEQVLDLNRAVIKALGITWGLTHLEVYLTEDGPLFGEVALRPPGGYIMNCIAEAWGFNPWEAFLAVETDQGFSFPDRSSYVAAATVFHPGEGVVRDIRGWQQALASPFVADSKLKISAGTGMGPRAGLGDDVGYILSRAKTQEEMSAWLDRLEQTVSFEMDV